MLNDDDDDALHVPALVRPVDVARFQAVAEPFQAVTELFQAIPGCHRAIRGRGPAVLWLQDHTMGQPGG